ncbi:type V toxin-antitoxin system endoribonuclease antitoxin GhoS [Pseudomonas sp. R32]|uniref:type V toxin-antitoxin system endoribonuclease antitoxin GhoS n=1 Tax=Pseudomonas sp. R32 TaxID=1573704 RepID=UPI00132EC7D0|nr:type V toxin-antitoxin system endoribonuclease antitoxin GhoS [Pseudomonas sp. R32]QHF27052.1 hypothetical protein PspR32_04325 [Pseudomonas sp. R32]
MTSFTVRVELHDADSEDYRTLHEAMEKLGFTNTITGGNGVTVQLPTAEYNLSSDEKIRQIVLDSVKDAVKSTKKKGGILVTQSKGRTWSGLDKVEQK